MHDVLLGERDGIIIYSSLSHVPSFTASLSNQGKFRQRDAHVHFKECRTNMALNIFGSCVEHEVFTGDFSNTTKNSTK